MSRETEFGPLVDKIQFDRVLGFIEEGKKEGAKCELGGGPIGTEGYFVAPTFFTNVSDDMRIAKEEIFGPVACILKFKTVDEVISRANATEFGLAAAVHTSSIKLASKVSQELEAGTVWINCYNTCYHQVPFGGYKVFFEKILILGQRHWKRIRRSRTLCKIKTILKNRNICKRNQSYPNLTNVLNHFFIVC